VSESGGKGGKSPKTLRFCIFAVGGKKKGDKGGSGGQGRRHTSIREERGRTGDPSDTISRSVRRGKKKRERCPSTSREGEKKEGETRPKLSSPRHSKGKGRDWRSSRTTLYGRGEEGKSANIRPSPISPRRKKEEREERGEGGKNKKDDGSLARFRKKKPGNPPPVDPEKGGKKKKGRRVFSSWLTRTERRARGQERIAPHAGSRNWKGKKKGEKRRARSWSSSRPTGQEYGFLFLRKQRNCTKNDKKGGGREKGRKPACLFSL